MAHLPMVRKLEVNEIHPGMYEVLLPTMTVYVMATRQLNEASKWNRQPYWRANYAVSAPAETTIDSSWYNFQNQLISKAYEIVRGIFESEHPPLQELSDEEYWTLFPEKRPELEPDVIDPNAQEGEGERWLTGLV